jgi:uncharacterized protein (TIGR03067 family)
MEETTMKHHAMLLAVMWFYFAAAHGQEKADPLEGNWSVVAFQRGGRKPPEELLPTLKVVIKGNTLRISDDKGKGEGAIFKLDRAKKPHEIDLVFKEGPKEDVERTALGIYELDGDSLKLAWRKDGGPRPTEFASIKGERTSEFLVLKREKGK